MPWAGNARLVRPASPTGEATAVQRTQREEIEKILVSVVRYFLFETLADFSYPKIHNSVWTKRPATANRNQH
ncbi:hypothetical protein [Nostoc sp.]|uniref:hypothetical protein n=1 Tax=Nostoc sp. TaxID=1180 RepID=UPI002FFCE09F